MSCNLLKYLENEEKFDLKIEYREYEKKLCNELKYG